MVEGLPIVIKPYKSYRFPVFYEADKLGMCCKTFDLYVEDDSGLSIIELEVTANVVEDLAGVIRK